MAFFKKIKQEKVESLKASDIAEHFHITAKKLNEIFKLLKWSIREENNWIVTELGKSRVAKQISFKGTKSIHSDSKIKSNFELINAIKNFKDEKQIKVNKNDNPINITEIMTNQKKKEKGDLYEEFIANHYRTQGYKVAEHGKDNGVKDRGIDIIAKKGREILFIQCKNWNANSNKKVTSDDMKIARQNAQDYKNNNPMYEIYNIKILYIMSENILHGSAYHYMQENSEIIEFRIIPLIQMEA